MNAVLRSYMQQPPAVNAVANSLFLGRLHVPKLYQQQ
jgi:hypothetical protein